MEPVLLGAWRGAWRGALRGARREQSAQALPPGARAPASTPERPGARAWRATTHGREGSLSKNAYGMELLAGTGAMAPTPERGVACTLRNEGELWMFDCARGRRSISSMAWGFQTLTRSLSHIFMACQPGLPGLLMAMAHAQQSDGSLRRYLPRHVGALEIYGPPGLYSLEIVQGFFGAIMLTTLFTRFKAYLTSLAQDLERHPGCRQWCKGDE